MISNQRALAGQVVHIGLREARKSLRGFRTRDRSWRFEVSVGPLRLVPVTPQASGEWARLVWLGDRPPAEGLAASPLGGAALTQREWRARVGAVRRWCRSGGRYAFLVEIGGAIVGEALASVDGSTELAEMVVWLHPAAAQHLTLVLRVFGDYLLSRGHARGVTFTAEVDDHLAASTAHELGFDSDAVLRDAPRPDRTLYVRLRAVGA